MNPSVILGRGGRPVNLELFPAERNVQHKKRPPGGIDPGDHANNTYEAYTSHESTSDIPRLHGTGRNISNKMLFSCDWHTLQGPVFRACTAVGVGAVESDAKGEEDGAGTRGDADGGDDDDDDEGVESAAFVAGEGLCHNG